MLLSRFVACAFSVVPVILGAELASAQDYPNAEPSVLVPDLPTVAASGLPGYEVVGLTGIWAPSKTPAAIINRLNQQIVRILNRAEVKQAFLNAGSEVIGSSPEEFAAKLKSEMAKWSKLIKDVGIKVE